MSYTPSRDDLDDLPMPDEWKDVADVVLPGNREQMAEGTHVFDLDAASWGSIVRMAFGKPMGPGHVHTFHTRIILDS